MAHATSAETEVRAQALGGLPGPYQERGPLRDLGLAPQARLPEGLGHEASVAILQPGLGEKPALYATEDELSELGHAVG